jgi:hypothetical protein
METVPLPEKYGLKRVAGEKWRKSVGTIFLDMKKYYIQSRKTGISHIQKKKGRLTGFVKCCVGTAF